jgi:hypothetical protein
MSRKKEPPEPTPAELEARAAAIACFTPSHDETYREMLIRLSASAEFAMWWGVQPRRDWAKFVAEYPERLHARQERGPSWLPGGPALEKAS